MTIIDIRGTHGSGKSHHVHQLIALAGETHSLMRDEELIGTYIPKWKTAVLGTYIYNCGGCDQIKPADEVGRRVRDFAAMDGVDNVILEGILVAHTFQRYSDLANEMNKAGHPYVFCFLDVSLELCIKRVQDRRAKRGWERQFDLFHITNDHKRIHKRMPAKLIDAGHDVLWLYDTPSLINLLENGYHA